MLDSQAEDSSNGRKNTAEHCENTAKDKSSSHIAICESIVATCFYVYDRLGYGYLERVYSGALAIELRRRGHKAIREMIVPVFYERIQVARYTADFVIDDAIVLEVKSTETLSRADKRQLLNYLRCTAFSLGILFHFGPRPEFHRFSVPISPHRP